MGEQLPRVERERLEQAPFGLREADVVAVADDPPLREVDLERPPPEPRRRGSLPLLPAAQQRPDAREESSIPNGFVR